jgi:hypothetical protein
LPDNDIPVNSRTSFRTATIPLIRQTFIAFALFLMGLIASNDVHAGILARQQLATPLAPDAPSSLSIPMPPNIDPSQPIWVSYRMLALSADTSPSGEIVLDGSFGGIATPINASTVSFSPATMTVSTSAGTIKQQFEASYGQRSAQEMQAILGAELYAAYEAVNAGSGRILDGTVVKTLPALGETEGILLVSVERANGMRPVGVFVTVGQGEIPAELKPAESVGSSSAYGAGRIFGGLLLLGLLYWFFIGRRRG